MIPFLKLREGSNEVRFLSNPFQYLAHCDSTEPLNVEFYEQKLKCTSIHGACELCNLAGRASARWMVHCFSYVDNESYLLDIGYREFNILRAFARDATNWGDPTKYDINFVVDTYRISTIYPIINTTRPDVSIHKLASYEEVEKLCLV